MNIKNVGSVLSKTYDCTNFREFTGIPGNLETLLSTLSPKFLLEPVTLISALTLSCHPPWLALLNQLPNRFPSVHSLS